MRPAALSLLMVLATTSRAHGLSAGAAELQLRGAEVWLTLAAPAHHFTELDTTGDGVLSGEEVVAQRAHLQQRFLNEFSVIARDGSVPRLDFFDVGVPVDALATAPRYVRFTARLAFEVVPPGVRLSSRWGPLALEAVRVESARAGEWSASRPAEAVTLRADGTLSPELLGVPEAPPRTATLLAALTSVAVALAAWGWSRTRSESVSLRGSP